MRTVNGPHQTRNVDTLILWFRQIKPFRATLLAIFVMVIIANIAWLAVPWGYKTLVDALSNGVFTMDRVWQGIGFIIGGELLTFLFFRAAEILGATAEPKTYAHLYNLAYQNIISQSHAFFAKRQVGAIVRQVNQYVESFGTFYDQFLWNILPDLVLILGSVWLLGRQSVLFAVAIIVWVVMFVTLIWVITLYKQRFDLAEAKFDRLAAGHLSDTITNNLTVRTSGAIAREIRRYGQITRQQADQLRISWLYETGFEGIQSLSMLILEILLIWLAVREWRSGVINVSDIVLLQAFLLPIMTHLWNISRVIRKSYQAFANARSLTTVFLTPNKVMDKSGANSLNVQQGAIHFSRVTFAYLPNRPVLRQFNLSIAPGEKLALVGPSGGGKSTITKLLLRLYDCESGSVLIDGHNIASVTQDSLQRQITYVPQEPLLFHRSILENIRYARPSATVAQVIAAAKLARAHHFISQFPHQYKTVVGERGTRLSGGERQRVILARAFLQNSPIIIMDEPTSSLDSLSEQEIQKALKELFADRTVIVIAHRLATIREMDRICVVKNGRITEEGTHESLTALTQGMYQKLWQIQAKF